MRWVIVGAHLLQEDVEPDADPVPVGDLYLSGVPVADDQPLGERELLVRVAGVRARLLERATFIAVRYGLAISSPEEAQRRCAPHLPQWRRILEQNRDNVEMTLKVVAVSPRPRPDRRDFSSGAEYLRALYQAREGASADPRFRETAERLFAPLAIQYRWLHRDEKSLELVALVPRARLDEVARAGEELRRELPQTPFLLSAPWPLEVFADADHE